MRIIKQADKERIERYRKAYPGDYRRTDLEVLTCLNRVRKDKRYLDKMIQKQVFEGLLTEDELNN